LWLLTSADKARISLFNQERDNIAVDGRVLALYIDERLIDGSGQVLRESFCPYR